jgi:LysM repeat protein
MTTSQNVLSTGFNSAVDTARSSILTGLSTLADRVANSPLSRLLASATGVDRFASPANNYVVKSGDTLGEIASAKGVSVAELARVNGIDNPNKIMVGDRLVIPNGSARNYTVRAGDTLSEIAAANGTTVSALQRLNGIRNADSISVGQQLRLSGGSDAARPAQTQRPATTGSTQAPAPGASGGGTAGPSSGRVSENGLRFLYNHEAQRGVSNHLHWPGGASGVTLGPGYDMRGRSADSIVRDLTAVGVDRSTATRIAGAAGLTGSAASNFASANRNLVSLTPAQEQALLRTEVARFEQVVANNVTRPLTQNQFDALVSFAYNIGETGFRESTALRRINAGDMAGGAQAMTWWNKSDGNVVQGLVNRRADEVQLFNTPGAAMAQPAAGAGAVAATGASATSANPSGRTGADYAARITQFGDAQARADLAAGRDVVVALRNETNTRVNNGRGAYDDTIAIVRRNNDGSYSVREFRGNTEPSAQYAYNGRKPMGRDMNGDGRVDQGRLTAGSYRFAPNGNFQGNSSYRATRTQVAERDTNQDGRFNASDSNRIDRTGAGTSMLIHQGGSSNTGSAGCQTMDRETYNAFLNAVGRNTTFSYVLINNS